MKLENIAAVLVLSLATTAASAATFSFRGHFAHDNDVQEFHFTVDAFAPVALRSWSYAGGTNAAGTPVARGGFDPVLTLFDSAGAFIDDQDDADCALVAADAVTGACYDNFLARHLDAGNYTVTIGQYANFSYRTNLSDGFLFDGVANQTFRNGFIDETGNVRDSHWALDILNVNAASVDRAVPEPAPLTLLGLALAGLAFAHRRKSAK